MARQRRALTPAELGPRPWPAAPTTYATPPVSSRLASGVDSALVATWASHSVTVLRRVYAHVMKDREVEAQSRTA